MFTKISSDIENESGYPVTSPSRPKLLKRFTMPLSLDIPVATQQWPWSHDNSTGQALGKTSVGLYATVEFADGLRSGGTRKMRCSDRCPFLNASGRRSLWTISPAFPKAKDVPTSL